MAACRTHRGLIAGAAVAAFCLSARAQLADGPVAPPETSMHAPARAAADTESKPLAAPLAKPGSAAVPSVPPVRQPGTGAWMLQTGLSLGAVLAIALGAGWIVRSLAKRSGGLRSALGAGGRSPSGILEILGRYPVGRGATLILLKLDRRILLISQTVGGRFGGGGFASLTEITDPEEVASILVKTRDAEGDSMAERFRSMLGRFDKEIETADAPASPNGRRTHSTSAGDSAEVWDTARTSIPIVDLTRQPGPPDGAASLRRRLAALRGGQHASEAGA